MEHAVLLITFNRPKYVLEVLKALKENKVSKLYVFKDGPRPNNRDDEQASLEIEKLIANIDWNCKVNTNFMSNNLGCGYGPYSAISWAFQFEEDLIILEDDCVPTKAFFSFCAEMLEKYKNNKKVKFVTGRSQMYDHEIFKKYDYIFTQYAPTLGWATWKRVWMNFDIQMRELKDFFEKGGFTNEFSSIKEAKFYNQRYKDDIKNSSLLLHVWDHQFSYHGRMSGALGIVPAKNLIKYIGYEGTHPSDANSSLYTVQTTEDFNFQRCPSEVKLDSQYDYDYFSKYVYFERNLFIRGLNFFKRKFLK